MKMTNGGTAMMDEALEDAVEATNRPWTDSEHPVCKAHDGIRIGVHALCLDALHRDRTASKKSVSIGKYKLNGYEAADVVKILGMVVVIILLAGDKVAQKFSSQNDTTQRAALSTQQIAAMETVAKKLIDETRAEMKKERDR